MKASSSALAKACNVKKSVMDSFLCQNNFDSECREYYDRDSRECIYYTAYDTLQVVKAFDKCKRRR